MVLFTPQALPASQLQAGIGLRRQLVGQAQRRGQKASATVSLSSADCPAENHVAALGRHTHVDPTGKVPSETCMAGMVYSGSGSEVLSKRRILWKSPTKRSVVFWKHFSVMGSLAGHRL